MKYFTKQWYRTNQCTGMHLLLEASDRAASFSEEYFQELYALRVQERLETMQRVQAVDRLALAAELADDSAVPTHADGSPITREEAEGIEEFRAAIIRGLQEAPPFVFDPEAERQIAHNQYLHELKHLRTCLPEEIRRKVADLRVLALRHATREIIDEIAAFSKSCSERVHSAYDLFRQDFKNNFPDEMPAFYRKFHLDDERLLSVQHEGSDILLIFEDQLTWRFRDAEFILHDESIEQCCWLMDEIYPAPGGAYEIHALLEEITEDSEAIPREFILRCRDAEIIAPQE